MKYFFTVIIQLAILPAVTAQINDGEPSREQAEVWERQTNGNRDTLLSIWYVQKALHDTLVLYDDENVPAADMNDSVYIRRLNNMPSAISLPYNKIIRNHIVFYMQKKSGTLETILGLSEYYLPIFEQILDIYDLPLEIRALPIIESALDPLAVSRVGATGMWQFMLRTGRQYGLTITSLVDERLDPIASAHAAAKFLNHLYVRYNDWTLAIAAYNCGAGNVDKAIARANGKRDYWEIYPYLPKETRNYVPAFVAASYALRYYKEHRLTPKRVSFPSQIDTFMINTNLHFAQISNVINIPLDELKNLNPQYKKNIIPGVERPYELRIPSEYMEAFVENEQAIYRREWAHFDKNIVKIPASKENSPERKTTPNRGASSVDNGKQQAVYRVQSGESLSMIAHKHGVKLSDLCGWNKIKPNSTIHPGQKLTIYKKGTQGTQATASTSSQKAEKAGTPKYHIVKEGESLWSVSQKYPGLSFNDLLKTNGLTITSKIHAGQKLKLP